MFYEFTVCIYVFRIIYVNMYFNVLEYIFYMQLCIMVYKRIYVCMCVRVSVRMCVCVCLCDVCVCVCV